MSTSQPDKNPSPHSGADLRQIDLVETRQVRLVVSIPALMFLYSLILTVLVHVYLTTIAEGIRDTAAMAERISEANMVLTLGIVGSFAAGVVGIVLAWQIVAPLSILMKSMREVSAGHLHGVGELPPLGEIGALGSTFNRMVAHLQDLFDERDRQMREAAQGTKIALDARGRVLSTDALAERVLGITSEQLLGESLLEEMRRHDAARGEGQFGIQLARLMAESKTGVVATATLEYRRRADETVPLSVTIQPVEAASEGAPHFMIEMRDLESMREFHEQMQRADRLAAVGTLATGIAHEIRNPLASIRAMAQLLREDVQNGRQSESAEDYLTRMMRETDRLDRLVASIRDFASKQESPIVPVDLNAAARHAAEMARHRVEVPEGLVIEEQWHLEPDLPMCLLEEARLQQALLNLFVNAREALRDSGGGTLRVESGLTSQRSKRPIFLRVANTSPELPRDTRERLFEPFFTTKAEGTGLGLPIAYQIIVANNGTLQLDWAEGLFCADVRFAREGRESTAVRPGTMLDERPSEAGIPREVDRS